MKVSGQATLRGPVDRVYQVLNDPGVLVRTIPGCERMEQVGPDAYRMVVTAGVASIKGSYVGDVRLTDQQAPYAFTLRAAGSGAPGTVSAEVRIALSDSGGGTTLLAYDAEAVVGGMIGGVGQRMLTGVAKKTAAEFFTAVDEVLVAGTSVTEPVGDVPAAEAVAIEPLPTAAVPGATPTAAATPTVHLRPAAAGTGATPGGLPAGFLSGALVGAAIALAGAVVGGLLAGRRRG